MRAARAATSPALLGAPEARRGLPARALQRRLVDRSYSEDLNFLKRFSPGTQGDMTAIAESLFSAGFLAMHLVCPSQEHLPSYVAALERGWSPNNERGLAATERNWSVPTRMRRRFSSRWTTEKPKGQRSPCRMARAFRG